MRQQSVLYYFNWLGILSVAFLAMSCKPTDPFAVTPISGPVVIDTQQQEFTFEKEFKPRRQVVKVCFAYSDDLIAHSISERPYFGDGTPLNLTAAIVDTNGNNYSL